jgi:opacity protein-like surface antigen
MVAAEMTREAAPIPRRLPAHLQGNDMKQLLLGTIGILSLGNAAIAADVPARAYTKAPVIDPASNWTGFYAGFHAGYGLGATELQILNIRTDGALGGVQAGYNQQIGNLLLGIEADISFSGINGNRTVSVLNQATLTQTSQINWLSTVTGRIGFANGRWLTYAKGGFAWANEDHGYDVLVSVPGPDRITLSGSETRRGWVVGAGMEYALANSWSLRGEYNFISFPDHDFDFNGTRASTGPIVSTASTKQTLHLIKLGANYQFGAPNEAKPIPPLQYAQTGFNWTGLYLGAQAGYGSGRGDWRDYTPDGKFSMTGGFGGGQIGANVQLGVIVMGVEGELVGGNIGGGARTNFDNNLEMRSRTEWLAMATARIGMVTNERWLTYLKGGVAVAGDHHAISLSSGPQYANLDGSRIHTGYVVGAGVEYAFAPNWSVKAEYNYIGFGHDKASLEGVINAPPLVGPYYLNADIAQTMQLGKIGVNYHFAP